MRALVVMIAGFAALVLATQAVAADAVPSDWVEVAAGPMFTVRAPAGTSFERTRTGDAFAGAFHAPGFDLPVGFGYPPDGVKMPEGTKNASETKLVVDEKPGAITKASTADSAHPFFVGLYVPDVEK